MSMLLKSSFNNFIQAETANLRLVKQGIPTGTVFYPVSYAADHITLTVTFPVAEGLYLNLFSTAEGWQLSGDFDLVIVADSSYFENRIHCGSYYVSHNIANCEDEIYIYNHNNYENGNWPQSVNGDLAAEGEWIYNHYSPIATIWFEFIGEQPGWFVRYN